MARNAALPAGASRERACLAARFVRAFARCRQAAIAPMMALMIVPIVGAIAYSVELGTWQYLQRSAQNAADSAALAAAIIDSDVGTTSEIEALAAAEKFGFVNGENSVTVTSGETECPAGAPSGTTCYEAIVGTSVPISLSGVLGFSGNQAISARAVAMAGGLGSDALTNVVCVWAKNNLTTSGTPDADLSGCAALAQGNMVCNGNGVQADYAVAVGTVTGTCASEAENNISGLTEVPPDPYADLAADIPANPCSSYPQASGTLPSSNLISGSKTGVIKLCGDVKLTGDVTLTGTGTQLVIYNGRLDLNRKTLRTAAGATATVIFTGTSGAYSHFPVDAGTGSGSGKLAIEAPNAVGDTFKGIAVYQDPALTSGIDFSYTGNKPAWEITGVVYLPKASVEFKGVVNKASDGSACQILIAYNILINGTGKIIGDVNGCDAAGVDGVDVTVSPATPGTRVKLVL